MKPKVRIAFEKDMEEDAVILGKVVREAEQEELRQCVIL